ncbi:Cytoplasmic axial filament protein CafA and Ribonuclease G [Candidatus Hydrogenisulfobacillus filiaventi]|uniref:Ribonuclease G n=1 Tax=Candidatus Hydrogenisulfobacillus filiaventi TaxID=2707344 RepID=A0A6F8ZIA0_9FIRM|nr:Cytoplasmic axial filament protein CafA and Ribonuclease G [Candidatus Hydrogenisulfobacillus filiaventi]
MTRRKRRRWGAAPASGPAAVEHEAGEEIRPETEELDSPGEPEPKTFRELLVNFEGGESRLAILEDGQLVEFYIDRDDDDQAAGNIYKGRVENVLPGMRAAFVNLGLDKNAFLYVDDANAEARDRRRGQPIQEVLKVGQEVVVQVAKEPIGTKGARVTTNISLPGRYLVLTPYSETIGVSRRIERAAERERLRALAQKLRPRGMGLIVRTVAQGASQRQLARDLAYLRRLWARIRQKARTAKAPAVLHREASLIGRTIRDHLDESVDRFIVDDPQAYLRAREITAALSPELLNRLEYYSGEVPLFEARGVEAELDRALKRRVWLRCGGYLVIDETEALTVIDVNTGKNVGTTDLADTVLNTNREAAVEIARQLRLRDISGIVVIDFIDMEREEDQKEVIRTFQAALRGDRTRVTVLGLTRLGLLELTRKKVRESLLNQLTRICPQCEGRGHVLSESVLARRFRQRILARLRESGAEAVLAEAHPSVAAHLIGPGGSNLKELEREAGKTVFIRGSQDCALTDLRIRKLGTRAEVEALALPVREGERLTLTVEDRHATNPEDGIARREGYVIDVQGAGGLVGEQVAVEVTRVLRTFATARLVEAPGLPPLALPLPETAAARDEAPPARRTSGRRRGRKTPPAPEGAAPASEGPPAAPGEV